MSRFSPSDAALEGFRLTREKPLAVLVWAVVRLLYLAAHIALFTSTQSGALLAQISTQPVDQTPEQAMKMLGLMGQAAPALIAILALALAFYAITSTAVLRAVLTPLDRAYFYLRISTQEVRQLGLAVLIFGAFFLYAAAIEIVSYLLIGAAKGLGSVGLPLEILVIIGVAAAFLYPAIRLSIAPAMTFADRKVTLFRAAFVTKGQFWQMLGTYVLALLLAFVIALLATVIFVFAAMALGAAAGGVTSLPSALGAIMQPQGMSFSAIATPLGVAKVIFGALLDTLLYTIMFAPAAAIFRELTGRVGAPAATAAAPKPGQPWG
jgi:hypothetical protein